MAYADQPLCRLWGEVTDSAGRHGRQILTADAWIAASALQMGVPLVTLRGDRFVSRQPS